MRRYMVDDLPLDEHEKMAWTHALAAHIPIWRKLCTSGNDVMQTPVISCDFADSIVREMRQRMKEFTS